MSLTRFKPDITAYKKWNPQWIFKQ